MSGAVTVGYIHEKLMASSFHHSMINMIGWDLAHEGRIIRGGYKAWTCGTDGLTDSRNKLVAAFLKEHDAHWLLWIDTDMGFAPDTLDRLFEAADPELRPIVGGLCFTQREEQSDGMGGWRCRATPTVFDWTVLEDGQMADAMLGHQAHAIFDTVGRGDLDELAGQDFFDGCLFGNSSLEHDFPGVITFGNNAHQPAFLNHEQRPDVLICHHLDGVEHG
jgi:hypothetical protein